MIWVLALCCRLALLLSGFVFILLIVGGLMMYDYAGKTLRQLRVIAWNRGIVGCWCWDRLTLISELLRWDAIASQVR